ncbi:MAG TPA: GTPase [Acidimicrobiia bacterium]|nr:GTPase [Acidimicrobiia bacterium]
MTRRQTRLHGDLSLLLSVLASADVEGDLRTVRDEAVSILEDYLLPRIKNELPLVIALIGSTGAGKSTLLNSLAGEVVSMPGALRPTTKRARVWAGEGAAQRLAHIGPLSVSSHPLLDGLALVDTPDLDSDFVEHRAEALSVAQASDYILFITTAARYGDQLVWETLESLVQKRPLAIVLNRVPSRSSGARNDLLARLRRAGLGGLEVFTISEQRIDPNRKRLSPQSVQRLAAFLRGLAGAGRQTSMNLASDRVAELVAPLRGSLRAAHQRRLDERSALEKAAVELSDITTEPKTTRLRFRRSRVRGDLADRIEDTVREALGGGRLSPLSTEILREATPPYSLVAQRVIATELALRPPPDAAFLDSLETGWQALLDAFET